jgi:hypothetical protein
VSADVWSVLQSDMVTNGDTERCISRLEGYCASLRDHIKSSRLCGSIMSIYF